MQKTVLSLQNIWKNYQMGEVQVSAIRGISLEIKKGEFVAIAGPSGSGKTTMLNLVGCLDLPSKGKILLDGDDISKFDESRLSQTRGQKIGFIFQQFNLFPTLNALENVMLPLEFQDMDSSSVRKKALSLLSLVGLKERALHLPSQLSGGEMQRVSIARALSVDPEIILADEPTGNLDSKTGRFIMEFLEKIHKNNSKTIIMVTHDINLLRFVGKIVYLKDGQIEKIKTCKKTKGGI